MMHLWSQWALFDQWRVPRWFCGANFVSACAIGAASYWLVDQPATNDFERFDNLWLTLLFFLVFAGWATAYVAHAARLFHRSGEVPSFTTLLPPLTMVGLPLLASFPVGSRDVFAYVFYGKMWGHHGANPFLYAPSQFSQDSWYPLLQAWWKDGATGYGPLFILQTRLLFAISGNNLIAAIALFKLFNLLVLLLAIRTWGQLCEDGRFPATVRNGLLLFAWSPLVLFEGLSSAHNDLVMAACLLGAYASWVRERWLRFAALWTLSIWYKWYSAVLAPVFLLWWWKRFGRPRWLRDSLAMAVVVVGVSAASLAPFGDITRVVLSKPWEIRIGSVLFPTELPPTLWPLFWGTLESGWFDPQFGRQLFDLLRYAAAGIVVGVWFLPRLREEHRPAFVAQDCFVTLLIMHAFLVPVLWPWHLLPATVFGLLAGDRRIEAVTVGLIVTGMLSYFLTFPVATLAVLLAATCVWLLRRTSVGRGSPAPPW